MKILHIYRNNDIISTTHYQKSDSGTSRKLVIVRVGAALVLVALVFIIIRLLPPLSPTKSLCAPSSIAVGGSTALFPLINTMVQNYHQTCPDATISIKQNIASSKAGLSTLAAGNIQIGNSDLVSSNLSLVDHPIAAVIYVMIVNQDMLQINNLSISQIQKIYQGSITNWASLGGSNEPITVVNRTSTSGTRAIFEKYILGGMTPPFNPSKIVHYDEEDTSELVAHKVASTRGAIGYVNLRDALSTENLRIVTIDGIQATPENVKSNAYTFWTIEHIYTQINPSDLTIAFVQYVDSNGSRWLISNLGYIPFHDIAPATLNQHPSPIAPDGL